MATIGSKGGVIGRPKSQIDKKQFEELCSIQCTEGEICAVLGVSEKTLINWCQETYKDDDGNDMSFSKVFAINRAGGKTSLRRKQWLLADKNATMAIFLGLQYLGQTNQPYRGDEQMIAKLDKIIDSIDAEASKDAAE